MIPLIDWDDLRFFLAVARCGSYSVAAGTLGVTQSTVGRRIAALDAAMGARLLHRTPDGYVPTAAGAAILVHVERVEAETMALMRAAQGYDSRLEGTVRVAAPEFLASRLLVPAFSALSRRHPKIAIELAEHHDDREVSTRDHDISIRSRRFAQPDLIVRSLGRLRCGLYASEAYLASHGHPDFDRACAGHRLILGRDASASPVDADWLGRMTGGATVALKAAGFETLLGAVASGYGIGALPCFVGEGWSGQNLQRLLPPVAPPPVELWLGVHQQTRNAARVRQVIDAAAAAIMTQERLLNPPETALAADPSPVFRPPLATGAFAMAAE